MSGRARRRLSTWGVRAGLAVFVVVALGPIVWGVVTSLYPTSALTNVPPDLDPSQLTLDNYRDVLASDRSLTRGW